MADRFDRALRLVGFIVLLVAWLPTVEVLTALPRGAVPDPLAALLLPR